MIIFDITSPNFRDPHEVTLYFKKIIVGRSKGCHIRVEDKDLPSQALIILNNIEGCLVEGIGDLSFKVNGKKIIGTKLLKQGDRISIGSSNITIKLLDPSRANDSLNHEALYDEFNRDFEEYENILSSLEKELIISDIIT